MTFEIHDELTTDDARMARSYLRRIVGWVLCALVIAGTAIWATKAHAQQINEQGCAYAADVAITSRALSAAGVERALAEKILLSMYTGENPLVQKVRLRVTDSAYRSELTPKDYSVLIFASCMASDGVLDKFLGMPI